jgi:hypothetical protein
VDTLVSVEFRNPTGSQVTKLTINAGTFRTSGWPDGQSTLLNSITFPEGLTELIIGEGAFRQDRGSLETLVFPDGLKTLDIGDVAFYKNATVGLPLNSITFPENLETLTIGRWTFSQDNPFGAGELRIKSLEFTDGLKTLRVGDYAFHGDNQGSPVASIEFTDTLK